MGCLKLTGYQKTDLEIINSRESAYSTLYNHDHLGNTRVVYTPLNAECGQGTAEDPIFINVELDYAADYYPYGKVLREYNPKAEKYVTTHHERDTETGLDYRGARYYDSDIARFLSLDPHAANYPGLSDYNYVAGNPVMFIDEDGKDFTYSTKLVKDDKGVIVGKVVNVNVGVKVVNLSSKAMSSAEFSIPESKGSKIFDYKTTSNVLDKNNNLINVPTTVNVTFDIDVVDDLSTVKEGDNVMVVTDKITESADSEIDAAGRARINGNVSLVEREYVNRKGGTQIVLHELAHNLGILDNYTKNYSGNGLMGALNNNTTKYSGNLSLTQSQKKSTGFHYYNGKGKSLNGNVKNNIKDFVKENSNSDSNSEKLE